MFAEFSDLHATEDGKALIATADENDESKRSSDRSNPPLGNLQCPRRSTKLEMKGLWSIHSIGEPVALTHLNDAVLAQLDMHKLDSFWFEAADKTKVQGFLIHPPTSMCPRNTQ